MRISACVIALLVAVTSPTSTDAWALIQSSAFTRRVNLSMASASSPEIFLYNSKTRSKEPLQTLEPQKVKMYTCGPTVYDSAHVGNFRAFLTYDVLKRALQYFGYHVDHICNLTDVDDKILMRCERDSMTVEELTSQCTAAFMNDLAALNIVPARAYPRATQHIDDMVEMIQQLAANDLAYQTPDGSWYFATDKDDKYGTRLVTLNVDEMESQERTLAQDDMGKRNSQQDFCLWKAFKEDGIDREDATWDTPIGRGRPGWHLECSAMARVFLGDTIDVHCGGIDLKFPHHENEIAQSEGASGKPFCECWIHNGFVNIDNEKMSKSKGNFLTLRAACPKPDEVRAYRYLVVSSQYRNPLNFTEQATKAALKALQRIDKVREQLATVISSKNDVVGHSDIATTVVPNEMKNFDAALLDDLSMPRAAASLFALIKAAETEFKKNEDAMDIVGLRAIDNALLEMDKVFGVFYQVPMSETEEQEQAEALIVPDEVMELVGLRTAAKDAQDWDLADSLRKRITMLGFKVKDVKGGEPIVSPLEA